MYPMRRESTGMLPPTPHYYQISGRATEIARALGSPVGGAEHLFLGMLHDGGWPVSAISGLVNLARAEAAVRGILDSPDYSPPPPPRSLRRSLRSCPAPAMGTWSRRGAWGSPSRWAIPTSAWITRCWR